MGFFDAKGPLVFAHRGGCALGPENTIAAFDRGLAAGADGLELDVHLSADGEVVVCHDATLDRTTAASGPVAALTAAELARIDAGCRFVDERGEFPYRNQGVTIPTLVEVLRRYRDTRIIVEMKVDRAAMGRAVAEAVRAADAVDRVCAAGYGRRAMQAVREALPELATSACHPEVRLAVYRSMAGVPVRRAPYGGYQVPECAGLIRIVSPRFIRHAHAAHLRVQVWTVDDERDMLRLLEWGVDGLISNRPDLAVRVRDRFLAQQATCGRRPDGPRSIPA
ncbi:MAG TPA: glycerophosphodiester phosphodiesterase [Vicinamibacterales bacterium]|nr:glycerophosphodiester phosphodiesterase [Vicinamibacterales bacterium]